MKIPIVFLAENLHGVREIPMCCPEITVKSHRRGVYGIDLLKQMDAIMEEVKGKTHITKWLGLDFSEAWGVSWAARGILPPKVTWKIIQNWLRMQT